MPDQCDILADYAGGPSVVLINSLSNFTGIETMLRGTDGLIDFGGIVEQSEAMGSKGMRIVPAAKGARSNSDCLEGRRRYRPSSWENFFDCVETSPS